MIVYHALTPAGRDLFAARPVCNTAAVPVHRLVVPNTATLLAVIDCRRCRVALNWPAEMDERHKERERQRQAVAGGRGWA